jgi:hypothetical protein
MGYRCGLFLLAGLQKDGGHSELWEEREDIKPVGTMNNHEIIQSRGPMSLPRFEMNTS